MSTQYRFASLDYETDPFKYGRTPKEFALGFYDGTSYWDFWGDDCTEQFINFLSNYIETDLYEDEQLIIYAHNGGKFDFFYLIEHLDPDLFMINGRIAKAALFGGRVEMRDSWLVLPLPLASNDKLEIDYKLFEKETRNHHKKEILHYLKRDCTSLHEWVTGFIDQFGLYMTLASAAFDQLKKTDYDIPTTFEEYDNLFRKFYYGGRVQCFEVGEFKGHFQYVDINSAYPTAMLDNHWYGGGYIEHTDFPKSKNGSWFAEIDAVSKGALPLKAADGKLYFPDDNEARRYLVTGWEINAGIETNTLDIKNIIATYRPKRKMNFSQYVNTFIKMKEDADLKMRECKKNGDEAGRLYWSARRTFAKLLLNSCYGKFGQDGRKFEKFCIVAHGEWPDDVDWVPHGEHGDYTIYSRPDPSKRFYNVATAASITGWVRAFMWKSINQSQRPLYCDTDSIICEKFNGDLGLGLGEWDMEARATEVYIAQRKMYAMKVYKKQWPFFDHKTASKGVRLTYDQIEEGVITGQSIVTERDAPAFSLQHGARFFSRKTDFENIKKNSLRNPLD